MPDINWENPIGTNNVVGRGWLESEIEIATPLLTTAEIAQIKSAKILPQFPEDLAKVIAAKAKDASASKTAAPVPALSVSQTAQDACAEDSWSNCGIAIKQELDRKPIDPTVIVALGALWGKAFDRRYEILQKEGHLEQATPDDQNLEGILGRNYKILP